jgi:hypothetical protein
MNSKDSRSELYILHYGDVLNMHAIDSVDLYPAKIDTAMYTTPMKFTLLMLRIFEEICI